MNRRTFVIISLWTLIFPPTLLLGTSSYLRTFFFFFSGSGTYFAIPIANVEYF